MRAGPISSGGNGISAGCCWKPARQGEREGVISPPADEEYILLTFNSIMQGVYRTICAGISVQGLKLEEDAYRILVKALQ